ncbi:MAG: hypothetical protein B7Z40_22690 [Bosea sp. 12-68-7]|nr:MAG: hypothetical protein B7Z40_22690 [Bosea sp. 12-68-7]
MPCGRFVGSPMGSGTGIVAEHFARLRHEVIAIETAESRAEIARRRLAPYPSSRVVVGDVLNPPLEVCEVDAIVSRNLMWLLPDPTVQGWRNLMAPGGGWRRSMPRVACNATDFPPAAA